MNREQVMNAVGALAGVALVAMVVYGYIHQQPIADRTLAILGVLLWATLQLDISPALPLTLVTGVADDTDDNEDGE